MSPEECAGERIRLDKWLWAARFFKTRALAMEAVSGGHVHVNGQRVKPARPVRVGDVLVISKGATVLEVVVEVLASRRGPAPEARKLYSETADSRARREAAMEQHRLAAAAAPRPDRRPDKRARRRIIRFRDGG